MQLEAQEVFFRSGANFGLYDRVYCSVRCDLCLWAPSASICSIAVARGLSLCDSSAFFLSSFSICRRHRHPSTLPASGRRISDHVSAGDNAAAAAAGRVSTTPPGAAYPSTAQRLCDGFCPSSCPSVPPCAFNARVEDLRT